MKRDGEIWNHYLEAKEKTRAKENIAGPKRETTNSRQRLQKNKTNAATQRKIESERMKGKKQRSYEKGERRETVSGFSKSK